MKTAWAGFTFGFLTTIAAIFVGFSNAQCACQNEQGFLNFSCLAYRPECKEDCLQVFKDSMATFDLATTVNSMLSLNTNVTGSLELNLNIVEETEPLKLEECSLQYSAAEINDYGIPVTLGNHKWVTVIDSLSLTEPTYFSFRVENLNSLVAGKVVCEWSNGYVGEDTSLLTSFSQGSIPAPTGLKSYFATRIYGMATDVYHATLHWSAVRNWPTTPLKYQTQCREVSTDCHDCVADFTKCRTCKSRGQFVLNQIVDWYQTYAVVDLRNRNPEEYAQTKPPLMLICSVRAVGSMGKSIWSEPVKVDFHLNPPPLLIMSQAENHKELGRVTKWYILDMMNNNPETGIFSVRSESRMMSRTIGVDAECCNDWNKFLPLVIDLRIKDPYLKSSREKAKLGYELPTSFSLNWVAGTHYEALVCFHQEGVKEDDLLWCILEIDDTKTAGDRIIYQAELGQRIDQVICNPYGDFVAFSIVNSEERMKKRGVNRIEIRLVFLTDLNLEEMLPDKELKTNYPWNKNESIPVASTAIAIDWTDGVGSILFLTQNDKDEILVHRYNRLARVFDHFSGTIQLAPNEYIRKIGVDWSHIYILKQDSETMKSKLGFYKWIDHGSFDSSNVYELKTMTAKSSVTKDNDALEIEILGERTQALMNVSVEQVIDFFPISGEMKKVPTWAKYYPVIVIAKNTSISKNALKLKIRLEHKSNLYALRPVLKVIVKYREHDPDNPVTTTCDQSKNACLEVRSGLDVGRLQTSVEPIIGNLTNGKSYYVEVIVQPFRATIYFTKPKPMATFIVKHKYVPPAPPLSYILAMILIPISVLVLCVSVWLCWYMTRPERKLRYLQRIPNKNLDEDHEPFARGSTCEVYKARMAPKGQKVLVAVKIPKDSKSKEEMGRLLQEAFILQHCNHGNIIKPIGICFDTKPFKLVLEYFPDGNLLRYLHQLENMSLLVKIQIGIDICKAGVYLDTKCFIHRDISAKNVLIRLGKDRKYLKAVLSDFGLAKDHGELEPYTTILPEFPILHSAPEAFLGRFTIQSDVFSFGTLMWEIFTGGEVPFSEVFDLASVNDSDIPFRDLRYLICEKGYRPATTLGHGDDGDQLETMTQPEGCPNGIWNLIVDCWKKVPTDRPTFLDVQMRLETQMREARTTAPQEIGFLPDILGNFRSSEVQPCSSVSTRSSQGSLFKLEGKVQHIGVDYAAAYSRDDINKLGEDEHLDYSFNAETDILNPCGTDDVGEIQLTRIPFELV